MRSGRSGSVHREPLAHPGPEAVERAYDLVASRYDSLHTSDAALDEDRWIRADLFPRVTAPVLDLGSGTGYLLDLLPGIPAEGYTGIELSAGMIEQAQRKHKHHRFHHGDFHDLTAFKGARTIVALFNVIEHAPDPFPVYMGILDALLPGGLLYAVIATPRHAEDPTCPHNEYVPPGSLRYWHPEDRVILDTLFERVTIEVVPNAIHPGHYIRLLAYAP